MKNITLKRIFYIYSEAAAAVFFAIMSLLELMCYFVMPPSLFAWIALSAAVGFALIAASMVNYIYQTEKRYSLVTY
jgi:hypothetical protein